MIYYLDASALVKVYCYEEGTEAIVNLLRSEVSFYSSIVVYSEVLFTLRRKMKNKDIGKNEFLRQTERFKSHFQTLINCIQISDDILNILENKVLKHSMRALDAIHLASALLVRENIDEDCIFVCSDYDLLNFAKEENFDLINPAETGT